MNSNETTDLPTRAGLGVALVEVSKFYPVADDNDEQRLYAAQDITLEVEPGSTVALTGASGSGKSTLLHLIGGMDRPSAGTITVDGTDLGGLRGRRMSEYRRSVGFVFQRFHLLPTLSVHDNVLAPLLPVRGNRRLRGRVDELIDAVGLAGRERALPSQLSGGQQQRVAIARALVGEPRLLLADEPTGNLDSTTGEEILTLLFDLQAAVGMTILLATHDLQVATRCDRLLRLRDGAVIEDTPIQDEVGDLLTDVGRLRA